MEVRAQLHTPATLPKEKEPTVPIKLEGGWATEAVWILYSIKSENFLITCAAVSSIRQALLHGKIQHECFMLLIVMFDMLVIKKRVSSCFSMI
jgi:hypothetical protein